MYRNKIMVRDFRLRRWNMLSNEHGKGAHRHYGDLEEDYNFSTVEKLMSDFLEDVSKIQQGKRYEEKIELTSNES